MSTPSIIPKFRCSAITSVTFFFVLSSLLSIFLPFLPFSFLCVSGGGGGGGGSGGGD